MPPLWIWVLTKETRSLPASNSPIGVAVLAGLFFAADLGVWHWSIAYTTVANSTLLANVAPIFVTLGGWLLWGERVSGLFVVGMIVAFAGMILLVGPSFSLGDRHIAGDALGLLTAVFYAGYMLSIKRARDGVSTAVLMALATTVSVAALMPVALLSPQAMLPDNLHGWAVLIGLALISQVLGQSLIAYGVAHLSAALSSLSLLVQPLVAAMLAWILFAESLGGWQLAGGMLVLAGIFVARSSHMNRISEHTAPLPPGEGMG